jgi:hypothetical protein
MADGTSKVVNENVLKQFNIEDFLARNIFRRSRMEY